MRKGNNYYSHVSLWEMAIKCGLGKLHLSDARGQRVTAGEFVVTVVRGLQLSALTLGFDDLTSVEALPPQHRDPFDRLLVVQARRYNLAIVSPDPCFELYDVARIW